MAFAVAIVLAVAISLAVSAGSRDETWTFHGEEYGCGEIPMALAGSADAWKDQCG